MNTTKRLNLDEITVDAQLQARDQLDGPTVEDYAAAYREHGCERLPPLTVYHDGLKYWLCDGFHRLEAARQAELRNLPCEIRQGSWRDALLYACGANAHHGLRRSNADKRRAVSIVLADPEWRSKSDRWIADACRVTHPFVAKLRQESTGNVSSCRMGRDGKTRTVQSPLQQAESQIVSELAGIVAPYKIVRDERLYRDSHDSAEDWLREKMAKHGDDAAPASPSMAVPPLLDTLKREVPEALRESCSNSTLGTKIGRAIDDLVRQVEALNEQPGWEFLSVQNVVHLLADAKRTVTECRFWTTCPRCDGEGCDFCSKYGYLPHKRKGTLAPMDKRKLNVVE